MSYLALHGPLGALGTLGADVQSLQNQLALAKTQVGTLRSQTATYRPHVRRSAVQRRRGSSGRRASDNPKTVTWGRIYDLKKGGNRGFDGLHRYPNLSPNVATIVSAIDTAKANVKALEEQIKRAKAARTAAPQTSPEPEVPPLEVPAVEVPESQPSTPTQSTPQPSTPVQQPQMTPPILPQAPLRPGPAPPAGKKGLNKGLLFGGAAAAAVVAGMFLLGD